MASCVHCRGRKGKRQCPALRGPICAACCGEYRRVEIACPSDCVYLESNEPYQRRRQIHRAPPPWVDRIVRYERRRDASVAVLHAVHLGLAVYAVDRGALGRDEAQQGLEFARRRMGPLETPEAIIPPLGESLLKRLDRLIQAQAMVERERVREVLDETLRHLDAEVPAETFGEFLAFLQALYGEEIAAERRDSPSGGPLILPG